MRVGGIFFGYGLLGLLLFIFGIIEETSNPFLSIFLYGGSWTSFLTINGIISGVAGLSGAIISIYGAITKNRYMLMGGILTGVIFNYMTIITPIIPLFPSPIGQVVYSILGFLLVWSGFEFWGGVE